MLGSSSLAPRLRSLAFAAAVTLGLAAPLVPHGVPVALAAEQSNSGKTTGNAADTSDDVRYRVQGTDGEGLRIRKEPGVEGKVVAYLPEGAIVWQRDGKPVNEDGERWLPVGAAEGRGWVASRYLERIKAAAAAAPSVPSEASFAERVVALARSQTGQPYVWGGTAPGGFDCSGFVQWVYTKAGLPMARQIEDQLAMGKPVGRDSLKPGDLVTFVNTYQPGLSHAGVYLGDNLFENASDESHGVTVSSLLEPYWADRYYKAVRFR